MCLIQGNLDMTLRVKISNETLFLITKMKSRSK